jgi:hypothetical protein
VRDADQNIDRDLVWDCCPIEALERRPEALRVGCAIAEEVLQEHRRDISSITPSKCLVNLIYLFACEPAIT